MRAWLVVALALAVAPPAMAEDGVQTVVTSLYMEADAQEGHEHRATVTAAYATSRKGDQAGARVALAPALAWCDAQLADASVRAVAVADDAQFAEFAAQAGAPPRRIDLACAYAYQTDAFIAVEDKRPADALAALERATRIAPFWSEAHAERGYILSHGGRLDEGLAAYRLSLDIGTRYRASPRSRAMALRGIGWTLVELGDLAGARRAFEQSLELDPGNGIALSELAYIGKLEATAKERP
jgi:tetratricopeptide (TPR) repeat protein